LLNLVHKITNKKATLDKMCL